MAFGSAMQWRSMVPMGLLVLSLHAWAQPVPGSAATEAVPVVSTWPTQLRMQVPFEPTVFPSNGANRLLYELYLTNFSGDVVAVERIDVLDAGQPHGMPVATFAGRDLDDVVQPLGADMFMGDSGNPINVEAGGTLALFLSVAIPAGQPVPDHLLQRVTFKDGMVEGAPIGTHHTVLKHLGPPVQGANWLAADGPGNGRYNHHRRGILVNDGALSNSRRFAVDWKPVRDGATFSGDAHADAAYFAYDKPVFAVADAVVVAVRDGLPDNPPGHGADFHPAMPVTFDNVAGNVIVLDLGDGQYAHYDHLQPGSILVKEGGHVRLGQPIARIGASGDAREPHLHFDVTTAISALGGEGVPYAIDHYRVSGGDGFTPGAHADDLPADDMVVDFPVIAP